MISAKDAVYLTEAYRIAELEKILSVVGAEIRDVAAKGADNATFLIEDTFAYKVVDEMRKATDNSYEYIASVSSTDPCSNFYYVQICWRRKSPIVGMNAITMG